MRRTTNRTARAKTLSWQQAFGLPLAGLLLVSLMVLVH